MSLANQLHSIRPTKADPDNRLALQALTALDHANHARVWRQHYEAEALATYGDGDGTAISGCLRAHFPDATKDSLRNNAQDIGRWVDTAVAHWRKSGRMLSSLTPYMRAARTLPNGEQSYY